MRSVLLFLLAISVVRLYPDVVECQNGDRYNGRVLLVDEHNVKLTNEITGLLTIPRAKVSTISFGSAKAARPLAAPVISTNAVSPNAPLKFDANAVQQIQNQLLGDASPEATQMYQEMIHGLMSGKMDLGDLRNQAQKSLSQLKDLQKDLGDDDAAALLGSYASILQNFINQAPVKPEASGSAVPKKEEE